MKQRKIPSRMCVGCREKKIKSELIRVVRLADKDISEQRIIIDPTGKKPGRGAYICPQYNCLEKAIKSKALDKALEITLTEDIYSNLKERLVEYAGKN